jgi:hypothetical protein
MNLLHRQVPLLFVIVLGIIVTACTGGTTSPDAITSRPPGSQPAPSPAPSRFINVWVELATEGGFNRPIGAVPVWALWYSSDRQTATNNSLTSCSAATGSRRNLCSSEFECGPSSFEDSAHSYYAYVSSPLDNLGFARALVCGYASENEAIQVALNLCNGGGRRCQRQASGSVLR